MDYNIIEQYQELMRNDKDYIKSLSGYWLEEYNRFMTIKRPSKK